MPTRFKVESVQDASEWKSNFGPMIGWTLDCLRDDGAIETLTLNSKPDKKYKPGDVFWAESTGQEYRGVTRYKRVQAPDGPQSSGNGPSRPAAAPAGASMPVRSAMPYEQASLLIKRLLDDFGPVASEFVFSAILDGRVENPIRPKLLLRYMGNEIESGGITQAQFDEVMELSKELARETDEKNVRAILIATTGVMTRKDLDEAKAKLFIETLKMNLAAIEAAKPPPPDDRDFSPEDF